MTTIAASVKHNAIACDLQATYNGSTRFKLASKVLEVPPEVAKTVFQVDKCFIGFAGNLDSWGDVVHWFHDITQKPPRCKGLEFLMLTDKKQLYHGTNMTNWVLLSEPHFAIGSGMDFAIAAMSAGKTPLEACKIAGKHDIKTGMGYKEYSF